MSFLQTTVVRCLYCTLYFSCSVICSWLIHHFSTLPLVCSALLCLRPCFWTVHSFQLHGLNTKNALWGVWSYHRNFASCFAGFLSFNWQRLLTDKLVAKLLVVSVNIVLCSFGGKRLGWLVGSPVRSALVLFSAFETSFVTAKTLGYAVSIEAYKIKQGVLVKNQTLSRT